MKKLDLSKVFLAAFIAVMLTVAGASAQTVWGCGDDGITDNTSNVTATLENGTLTINGTGNMKEDYNYPWDNYKSSITKVIISDGVTSFGSYAFYGCSNLTEVTIPNGVTSIGDYAFYNCSNLTEVIIPNSVTSIGDLAFYNCSNLTKVTIPDGVTSIGEMAFYCCSGLTEVTVGNGVTSIGSGAFANSPCCLYAPDEETLERYNSMTSLSCIRALSYTVKFDAQDGGEVTAQTGLPYGAKATAPTAPVKTGYTFGGWYKEADCINEWDFAVDEVTEAGTTLYAKWNNAANPISNIVKSGGGLGITFTSNMVGDEKHKQFEIREVVISRDGGRTVTGKVANVIIYDNVGNVVFSGGAGENTWDLRNKSGRFVANGSYLVVVEAKSGYKSYWYSAKIAVKRK